jgi:hypothetical protein
MRCASLVKFRLVPLWIAPCWLLALIEHIKCRWMEEKDQSVELFELYTARACTELSCNSWRDTDTQPELKC